MVKAVLKDQQRSSFLLYAIGRRLLCLYVIRDRCQELLLVRLWRCRRWQLIWLSLHAIVILFKAQCIGVDGRLWLPLRWFADRFRIAALWMWNIVGCLGLWLLHAFSRLPLCLLQALDVLRVRRRLWHWICCKLVGHAKLLEDLK